MTRPAPAPTPQLGLPLAPRTRNTDPVTSHLAEAEVRDSGSLATQAAATLDLVRAHGPASSSDLARFRHDAFHSDYYQRREQIRRRLGELAPEFIEKIHVGKRELVWRIVQT